LSILIAGVLATATGRESTHNESPEFARPRSASPFEIARVINLRQPKPSVDLKGTWQRLGTRPGYFETCEDCTATLDMKELDGNPGKEVVLELAITWVSCRYLIFTRPGSRSRRWRLLGYV